MDVPSGPHHLCSHTLHRPPHSHVCSYLHTHSGTLTLTPPRGAGSVSGCADTPPHSKGEPEEAQVEWEEPPSPLPGEGRGLGLPSSPGVRGSWGFRGGAGGLDVRSHRPPAMLLTQPPASWGQRGGDPPHRPVERITLIWGLPRPSRPCRVGGALWEMVGGFRSGGRRRTAPAARGRRPALR